MLQGQGLTMRFFGPAQVDQYWLELSAPQSSTWILTGGLASTCQTAPFVGKEEQVVNGPAWEDR